MKIKFTDIDNALKYYEINDNDYKNKCYKCVEDINSIDDFNVKSEEIYNILYNDKSVEINKLWKIQNMMELFGENYNPFITNVLVLLGYELHDINMKKKNYDNTQKELYKKRVKEALTNDIFIRKLEGIRISQMILAAYFINAKLIEVGRLQYEKCENYIKIHIPSGEKLELEKVLKSLKDSKKEIEKYFNMKNPEYHCDSWLLSNQVNAIVDSNSNIAKFYRLFDVEDGPDATKDILNFVFEVQECNDYNDLKDNGDIVFYTGLTPASNSESNVGFILANPRAGTITRYTCSGAEEKSAQDSAESLVQDLKYEATFPTVLNVDGKETYFMLLKDKAGLVQRYALCNVENYTKVVQAETIEEALRLYRQKLGNVSGTAVDDDDLQKAEGIIQNLYQAQLDGCTYYYFTIEGSTNLYMSSIKNSNKQVMLEKGTKVYIEYVKTAEEGVFEVYKIQF